MHYIKLWRVYIIKSECHRFRLLYHISHGVRRKLKLACSGLNFFFFGLLCLHVSSGRCIYVCATYHWKEQFDECFVVVNSCLSRIYCYVRLAVLPLVFINVLCLVDRALNCMLRTSIGP